MISKELKSLVVTVYEIALSKFWASFSLNSRNTSWLDSILGNLIKKLFLRGISSQGGKPPVLKRSGQKGVLSLSVEQLKKNANSVLKSKIFLSSLFVCVH